MIQMPPREILASARGSRIEQTYLTPSSDFPVRRVRRRTTNGADVYTYTAKRPNAQGFGRLEVEKEISREEYVALLSEREPDTNTIRKERYCITASDGHILEIDVFEFWKKYAVLEIELASEDEPYIIPEYLTVVREVTFEPEFYNASLTRFIPDIDDI